MANPALTTLLEVQRLDTHLDQLVHRRAALPERAAVAELRDEAARRQAERDVAGARAHELGRTQKRFEDEIAGVEEKAATTDRTLYGGSVTSPIELQALSEQLTSLRRRISGLEDELLVVLEELEPVTAEVEHLDAAHREVTTRLGAMEAELRTAEEAIDAELAELRAARAELVAGVPADLVGRYERIRARAGGVGIAVLDDHHRCTGCHLALPNREVDELRRAPADAVLLHEECGRILVLGG
jgi:predicted  nucleic acid-binding Zn-ribbon protein